MRGNRRLTVTILGQFLQVLPLLMGANVKLEYVIALAAITICSLFGYNVEDWLRISRSAKEIGETLIGVAEEIEKAANSDVATRPPT